MPKETDIVDNKRTPEERERVLTESEKQKKRKKGIPKLKHYLKSAWYWNKKKDYLSDKILILRSKAEKITTTFSDVPTFGGYEDHRQAVIAEMVDTQKKYENAVKECDLKITELRFFINRLEEYKDGYQECLVMEMRYLYFENWQDIALKLNYNERQIYRVHGRALLHLLEIHKKMVEFSGKELF